MAHNKQDEGRDAGGARWPEKTEKKADMLALRAMAPTRSTSLGQLLADPHFLVADVVNASKQEFADDQNCSDVRSAPRAFESKRRRGAEGMAALEFDFLCFALDGWISVGAVAVQCLT